MHICIISFNIIHYINTLYYITINYIKLYYVYYIIFTIQYYILFSCTIFAIFYGVKFYYTMIRRQSSRRKFSTPFLYLLVHLLLELFHSCLLARIIRDKIGENCGDNQEILLAS